MGTGHFNLYMGGQDLCSEAVQGGTVHANSISFEAENYAKEKHYINSDVMMCMKCMRMYYTQTIALFPGHS